MAKRNRSRGRRALAFIAISLIALVFAGRLVDVQMVSAEELNAEAKDRRAVPRVLPSLRGDVVDRDGVVLATTDERYDVNLSPKNTRVRDGAFYRPDEHGRLTIKVTREQAYDEIGEITGQEGAEIAEIVDDALADNPDSDFASVKRAVDLTSLNRLKALAIPWLTFENHYTRTYPSGAVAGNIVGYAGFEGVPQAGVEYSFDACLTGEDGLETYERGADGVPLPGSVVLEQPAVDGGTVELTIDRDLNWQAQQIINQKVAEVGAEWGYLVIMEAKTGELVAVAEDGSVDPNDIDASDPAKWQARAFVNPYEPGSTFKTITAAALIDQGAADASTQQLAPYEWEPEPGVRFNDSFEHGPERWTLAGVMTHSSNVGISMLGSRLSEATRYDYLQRFGIGTSTEAGMPQEDSGLLYPVDQWDRQTSYNTMFGQGVSSTIVQTAGVYQALANGGLRIPPSIVRSCTDAEGKVTEVDHGEPVQVVSESTADQMLDILETVVRESYVGRFFEIPGYRVGGKTGTAEQVDPNTGLYRSDYVHSFAGVFPNDDPQYVAVASIGFPSAGDGGAAAVGSFFAAAEATIRHFHIPPSSGEFTPLPTTY